MSKSNKYSFWSNCIQNNFTKSIDSNQLSKILFLETFATVFVREFHSYETDVKNLNCLLFKITTSWLKIWNESVRVQQKHYFELIFLLQLVMQNFLRQCLIITSTKFVALNSLLLLFVIYWNLHRAMRTLTDDNQLTQLLFFSWSTFAKSFSLKQYENFTIASNAIYVCCIRKFCWLDHWRYSRILTDFSLVLSNVNFLSHFWSQSILYS